MKNIFTILFVALSQFAFAQNVEWIPFEWHEESFKGRHFEKAAIFVPVNIDGLPHKFVMQFDLGADATMIYGNSIKPFLKEYDELNNKLDTSLPFYINGQKSCMFKDVELKLGNVSLRKNNIGYYDGYGSKLGKQALKKTSDILIGTIGTDITRDKVLIIDYPNKRLCITNSVPKEYLNSSFQSFKIKYGKIVFTLMINGTPEDLLFDTGSSIFAITTLESNIDLVANKPNIDSFKAPSWGKIITSYGRKTTAEVKLGNKVLGPTIVYYDNDENTIKLFKEDEIWGIAGNAYFLNNVVIIDWTNKRIGIQ